jgi:hypothetical protein
MRQAAGDDAFVELLAAGDAQAGVVEERARALLGHIELVIGRIVDQAGNHLTFARQTDRDCELRDAVQEVGGAIERVDDPGMALVSTLAVAALLTEEAIARAGLVEVRIEHLLGPLVGEADEIGGALHRDLQVLDLAEVALQAAAGAARGFHHHVHKG